MTWTGVAAEGTYACLPKIRSLSPGRTKTRDIDDIGAQREAWNAVGTFSVHTTVGITVSRYLSRS
jgi:hypothetical protein